MEELDDVHIVAAKCVGTHAVAAKHVNAGMVKSIPRTMLLAIGMMVKLTVNTSCHYGLNNGARGTVVDIVYPVGAGYSPDVDGGRPLMVIVNFPGYTGPPTLPNFDAHSGADPECATWVPVVVASRVCEKRCCSRDGLTLVVGKADTVHACQGSTVGEGHAIKRILLKWSGKDDQLFPNIFYVGASRAKNGADLCLVNGVSGDCIRKVAQSAPAQKMADESARLEALARHSRGVASGRGLGTVPDFFARLDWLLGHARAKWTGDGVAGRDAGFAVTALACIDQWTESLDSCRAAHPDA